MDWNFLGNQWAVSLLQEHLRQRSFRHAYLFTGPQGVGRRTLALRFAQALNCPQPKATGVPCRSCHSCRRIEAMRHPDLTVVQAERIGGSLKVNQIRELQHQLVLTPYETPYRVALLLRFEEATASAANALLKALEEPPPQVVLLLTAESSEQLLSTIVSRCEVLRLRPVNRQTIAQGLENKFGIQSQEALKLAHLAMGRPGYAIQIHNSPELMEQRTALLEEHYQILQANRVERFAYVTKIYRDRSRVQSLLQTWTSLWRDVVIQATGASSRPANIDRQNEISQLATHFGLKASRQALFALQRTDELLNSNVNPRLALEVLLLDFPHLETHPG